MNVNSAPAAVAQSESDEQIIPSISGLPDATDIPSIIKDILDVVPYPLDLPIIESLSGDAYKCEDRYHNPIEIAQAVRFGNTLRIIGTTLGFKEYPHVFNNRERLPFHDLGPYMEFPIMQFGKLFTGGSPLKDRVLFNANSGSFVGVITHTDMNNGFKKCARVPSVLDKAKKPILRKAKNAVDTVKPILKNAADALDIAQPILQGDGVGAAKAVLGKVAKPILRGITGEGDNEAAEQNGANESPETDAHSELEPLRF